jgi:hypothetical protein
MMSRKYRITAAGIIQYLIDKTTAQKYNQHVVAHAAA